MIARRQFIQRGAPPRKRRLKARRGPIRLPKYRRFLTLFGRCAVPGCNPNLSIWTRIIDPAHTENNGTSSKGPDTSCAPLCRHHHREYDAGRSKFESKYGIDMRAIARHWYARWVRETAVAA